MTTPAPIRQRPSTPRTSRSGTDAAPAESVPTSSSPGGPPPPRCSSEIRSQSIQSWQSSTNASSRASLGPATARCSAATCGEIERAGRDVVLAALGRAHEGPQGASRGGEIGVPRGREQRHEREEQRGEAARHRSSPRGIRTPAFTRTKAPFGRRCPDPNRRRDARCNVDSTHAGAAGGRRHSKEAARPARPAPHDPCGRRGAPRSRAPRETRGVRADRSLARPLAAVVSVTDAVASSSGALWARVRTAQALRSGAARGTRGQLFDMRFFASPWP